MTSTLPVPFTVDVSFFSAGINSPLPTPEEITITQAEFAHDLIEMRFWAGDVDSSDLSSGSPISITWGRSTVKRTFTGYVNHATRMNNALANTSRTNRNSVTITCVGASWPMKETGTRTWFNYTASRVVQEIAAQFHLDANIVYDSMVWPNLPMAGRSYWEFCCDLAKRIGYTFYCNGVQLVFKPRTTNPAALVGTVVVYDYQNDPGNMPVFTPVLGANSPGGGQLRTRSIIGIDPKTNQYVYSTVSGNPSPATLGGASAAPVFGATEHDTIDTVSEAISKTTGAGLSNQLYITATAVAAGSPLLSQGTMVFVENANGGQNGLWFTQKVIHQMSASYYTSKLFLGRDSTGATTSLNITPTLNSVPKASLTSSSEWVAA